jgi:PAS domain S-box-containing protein
VDAVLVIAFAVASGLVSSGVAALAWSRRATSSTGRAFAVFAAGEAFWTFGYVCELLSDSMSGKVFWDDVQLVGTIAWPCGFYGFARRYVGRRTFEPRWFWAVLALVMGGYLVLAFTDPLHHLVRPGARLVPSEPFDALVYPFTTVTWIGTVVLFGTFLYSIGLLVRHLAHAPPLFRRQIAIVVTGAVIPLAGIVVTMLDAAPGPHRDVTPVTFALGNLAIAYGMFRYELTDLGPVARAQVIEHLADAVVVVDNADRVVDLNLAARALLADGTKDVLGRPQREVFAAWSDLVDRLSGVADVRTEIDAEVGGTPRVFDVRISTVRDESAYPVGRVSVARDITALKRAERTLAERYADLEEANQSLDAFAQSVSHDLRAPLRAIDGLARIVLRSHASGIDDEGAAHLSEIRAQTTRMSRLIDDLLAFARSGRQPLVRRTVRPAEIVASAWSDLSRDRGERTVELIIGELPECSADRALFSQLFTNLLDNARKYTRSREDARVEVGAELDGGKPVYFVRDNGVGFDPEQSSQIFEPFTRLHDPSEYEGSGIGLAVAHRIVTRHGGRIWAESSADGATFRFTIE